MVAARSCGYILLVLFVITKDNNAQQGVGCRQGTCIYGTCVNKVCVCDPGYSGQHCDYYPEDCSGSICYYGTCVNGGCVCDPGYEGLQCGNSQQCPGQNCIHGVCFLDECVCDPGHTGNQCNMDLPCYCQNGATCVWTAEDGQQASYTCNCAAGYTGPNCIVMIATCASSPCQHGGTCTDLVTVYSCSCLAGYGGDHCQNVPITDVEPSVGPMSGGTLVTVTGSFVTDINFVTIGAIPCQIKERTTESYVCLSGPLTDETQLDKSLDVIVYSGNTNTSILSGFDFKYQPDPIILKIEPLESIESGGSLLTVSGQHFNIVQTTLMVTHVRSLLTAKQYSTETNCTVESSTELTCLTPEINLGLLTRKRKRRQATTSLNIRDNIEVEISFRLDGVQEYRNLTVGTLTEYSKITIYADPILILFSPLVRIFTPTWPVNELHLEIKGETLLKGLRENAYFVKIGEAVCANMDVQDNVITCEPPKTRPRVSAGDFVGDNRIPVKVLFASKAAVVGQLEYRDTMWEHPPAKYGIISSLCVLGVILIVISCCLYRRRPPTHSDLATRAS